MTSLRYACAGLVLCSLATPWALADTQVQIELLLESFDGCGCIPLHEPACTTCRDLDGSGCNVHDGNNNAPHASCPFPGNPFPHPNFDVSGPQSLDEDWWNQGFPVDYAGDFAIHNDPGPFPPNVASQSFTLNAGTPVDAPASANIGFINRDAPQVKVAGFGQIDVDAVRQAYGLPAPDPAFPDTYLAFDVRRFGDGYAGGTAENPALGLRTDLIGVDFNPVPNTLAFTFRPAAERMVPNDSQWHTYRIVDIDGYPQKMYLGIGLKLEAGANVNTPTTGALQVWIDNLKLVYTATVPDAETDCDDGVDNDFDGQTDCNDTDCANDPICTGCAHDPVFDLDDDNDVDGDDFGVFQTCITGPGDPENLFETLSGDCQCMDTAGQGGIPDNAIDQQDFGDFQLCASGPTVPLNPANCP